MKLLDLQQGGQRWFLSMMILISLLWLGGDSLRDMLAYQQQAVHDGQVWRLITGHLVHSNLWHLLLNLASLTLIGVLFGNRLSGLQWASCFIYCALVVSGLYLVIATEYSTYVGLSAVLYGAIIVGALEDFKDNKFIAGMLLVIVTARVIWQQFEGPPEALAEMINDRVAIESHLFGLASGYFFWFSLVIFRRLDTAAE
jgi:rhomboid family GlyGly-CTERM serine protease